MPTFHDEHSLDDSMMDSDISFISEATPHGTELSMVSVAPPVSPTANRNSRDNGRGHGDAGNVVRPAADKALPEVDMGHDEGTEKDGVTKDSSSVSSSSKVRQRKCFWILVTGTIILIAIVAAMLVFLVASGGSGSGSQSAVEVPSEPGNEPTEPGTSPGAPTEPTNPSPEEPTNPAPSPSDTSTTPAPTPSPVTTATDPPNFVPTQAPSAELFSFLAPKLPDGGFSLQFTDSYQSKAFEWLEANHVAGDHTAARVLQRFALASIYYATYSVETPYTIQEIGPGLIFGWIRTDNWVQAQDECTWYGITCNDEGLVEEIDLSKNFLTGQFPPEVVLLKDSLVRLDLFRNNFYNPGEKWNSFIGDLTLLQDLSIGQTGFEYDGIPPFIGQLSNLVDLDVSYALFFGALKPEIFDNLPNLEYLYIGGNSFNTPLPSTFSSLSKLKYFYAEFTDLTGDLSFFKNPDKHPDFYEAWIDQNPEVTGQIPPELAGHSKMASLSLTDLDLFGQIPTQLGDMVELKQLWLFGNRLSGNIPSELAKIEGLVRLELQGNEMTGPMPFEICTTKFLKDKMEILGADCKDKIDCPSQEGECCTCCGDDCSSDKEQLPGNRRLGAATRVKGREESRSRRRLERRDMLEQQFKDPELLKKAVQNKKRRLAFVVRQRELRRKS
mmetsp:Transcript_3482/g.9625  ORF Transcript_3482/g.9625 Transcript_3482/m.9625 type:complete len:667 (-) Transcript_3482:128-2128(-)